MIGSANLVGTTLGTHEIQALLGAGGMACVYRAFDRNLRPVAIKVLSDAMALLPGFARRSHQEALLIASLRHPNIIQIYDEREEVKLASDRRRFTPPPAHAILARIRWPS